MANEPGARYSGFMYAASKDMLAVEALAAAGLADHCEAIAFHCQQAAEKMVKNVFLENGAVPPKSHDVGDLLSSAIENGWLTADSPSIQAAIDLTLYAVAARYETSPDISEGEAKKAMQDCDKVAAMLQKNGFDAIEFEVSDVVEPGEDELLDIAAKRLANLQEDDAESSVPLEEVLSEEEYKRFIDIDPNDPPDDELFE